MGHPGIRSWSDEHYVTAYELARSGFSDAKIREAMGVSEKTWLRWKKVKPAFRQAIERGRKYSGHAAGKTTFRDYVYDRLPDDLKELWDQLEECEREKNGIKRMEALLENAGKGARQHLFLYALVHHNFNPSQACRSVNISRRTFDHWCTHDPDFQRLVDEIHWHKKNFYEQALVERIKEGDVACTIFANRTFNKDRGYSEKFEVDLQGKVEHTHKIIPLDALDLPLETRRQILQAYREKQALIEGKQTHNN